MRSLCGESRGARGAWGRAAFVLLALSWSRLGHGADVAPATASSTAAVPTAVSGTSASDVSANTTPVAATFLSHPIAWVQDTRLRRTMAIGALSALLGGAGTYFHRRSEASFDKYMASAGNFDRRWTEVRRWEAARDASFFFAAIGGLVTFVSATTGNDPGVDPLFSIGPAPSGFAVTFAR